MTLFSVRSYKMLTWLLPLLAVFAGYGYLENEATDLFSHIDGIRGVSSRIRKTGVHIRELPEMKADFENLARKKAAIASSLFGAQSEASLYELLLVKAREASVSITAMAPHPRRGGTGFTELPLTLEVSGGFDNITRFTGLIENVNRLMRIEELSMARDRERGLIAELRLCVYLYSDTAAPASSPPAKGGLESAFQKRENYLAELQNVLSTAIAAPSYAFTPSERSDPFGTPAPGKNGGASAVAAPDTARENPGVALKGILWKETPLAILETLDGRTFIVKKGEIVNGFTVSSITRTEVSISSPQGTHVLHQYNDK